VRVEIIVLAAGRSRRFGDADKLLAQFDGEALIVRTVRRVSSVRLAGHEVGISAVVDGAGGAVAGAIKAAGLAPAVRVVKNERTDEGIGTSVASGIASLEDGVDAAVIVPGDMPFVSADVIEALIGAFVADGGIRPAYPLLADGTQANPVIWPRAYFAKLAALTGDRGGKALLAGQACCTIWLDDPRHAADIDTLEDLLKLQAVGKSKR
jgi:molybdenum cofactor cytidylyltransferase